ncbi:MAG: formylglycine-generating enzyme family protein [Thermoanaerobaculia bacterium]|nr:formylglycine-generating enzyme family protein [Thermoanaerobaculia bacterium]
MQDRWLREQRELEKDVPLEKRFEVRARQLLLDQLGATRPEEELDAQWWRFKRAMHQAVLEPKRAAELLAWVHESAVAHEAVRVVEGELARHREGVGAGFSLADTEVLRAFGGRVEGVPARALLFDHRRLWAKAALFAAGAGIAVPGALFLAAGPTSRWFGVEQERQSQAPAMYALLEMVNLPGGQFDMGSVRGWRFEQPAHRVSVPIFQISKTEVTVWQYRGCVEAGKCKKPGTGGSCNWHQLGRENHPINCVSWDDAQRFAEWMKVRLPTEAEWEYAARSGGLEREYPWGDAPADCERAIIGTSDFEAACGRSGTWPVCSKTAGNTEQGLCDMAGNVWEWVEDDWHDDYRGAPIDGSVWFQEPRASSRVFRGGSWWIEARRARVSNRIRGESSGSNDNLGFRVARSLRQ